MLQAKSRPLSFRAQKTVKKPMMPGQHQPILTDDRFRVGVGVGVVKIQVGVVRVQVSGWGGLGSGLRLR